MGQRPTVRADRYGPGVAGGGRMAFVDAPVEVRGGTGQVCGLWPFGVGTGAPLVGVPMGRHLRSGATVCFDPISWYRAGYISNPNLFVAAQPGKGKSSAVRRQVLGLTAQGITPLVLGDLKPDYVDLIRALGGQVIRIGPGLDRINPLDAGPWRQALTHLDETAATTVRASVVSRRRHMVEALATLVRRRPLDDSEVAVLTAAIRLLSARETGVQPTLADVVKVIETGPEEVRQVTLDRGDEAEYRRATDPLMRTLLAVLDGSLGATFDGQTTTPIELGTSAVCVDISGIDSADEALVAAALMSAWAYGFAQVEASHLLADLGLGRRREYYAIMDELWRALRAGPGLVDRLDGLTRLSRQQGTGLAYITHSMDDLEALASDADKAKARGLAERCAAKLLGGLSRDQLGKFGRVVELSAAEINEVVGWGQREGWSAGGGSAKSRAGVGNFLLKIGSRPGIPVHLALTEIEQELGNTDKRFGIGLVEA
ncbi:hypothetical protein AMIS_12810 [Actinoplanes missouriensis 431]|uniref:ATP/GTP-binding protein n=1 Tax=Actinoplanes missouriensis (strain ATCC 14538 / DSM 43046 / CBS 188.64 / JCM 3121 / NBRC 102363 / NCIMB 12654 / NRRL B-3342 / UNCC 431) TaxID=512565 RepID=I0H0G4_ACTM4|nr:hypothetical protein [Actinoplanes missouriensis]BAL86501.1 hypothetical protein AMIS_12810 [Actinoplanes missouriensis 431]